MSNSTHPSGNPHHTVGMRAVCAVLPDSSLTLQELADASLLRSTVKVLEGFAFERAFIAPAQQAVESLALAAAKRALAESGLDPKDIHALVWAGAIPGNHLRHAPLTPDRHDAVLTNFQYIAGWLLDELGLINADVLAVTQQGCSTMFSGLRAGRALIVAEPHITNVLVVGADVLPHGSTREIMYNVISDAGCAVILSRDWKTDVWAGYHQTSRGYYWDTLGRQPEIIAAYFPTSAATIRELLQKQHLTPSDIDLVIPTGVSRASWEILMRLVGIPADRLYVPKHTFGHTILADNFLMLEEVRRSGRVKPGAKLLLFTYGFGSAWTGLILEH